MRIFVDRPGYDCKSIKDTPWAVWDQVIETVAHTTGEEGLLWWSAADPTRPPIDDAEILGCDLILSVFDPDAILRAAARLGWL